MCRCRLARLLCKSNGKSVKCWSDRFNQNADFFSVLCSVVFGSWTSAVVLQFYWAESHVVCLKAKSTLWAVCCIPRVCSELVWWGGRGSTLRECVICVTVTSTWIQYFPAKYYTAATLSLQLTLPQWIYYCHLWVSGKDVLHFHHYKKKNEDKCFTWWCFCPRFY